jgi:hypothetical protein
VEKKSIPLPLSMVVQRLIDDDRLSDECWNSEMREVQLCRVLIFPATFFFIDY